MLRKKNASIWSMVKGSFGDMTWLKDRTTHSSMNEEGLSKASTLGEAQLATDGYENGD